MGSPILFLAPSTSLLDFEGVKTVAQLKSKYPSIDASRVSLWFVAGAQPDPLAPSSLLSAHAPLSTADSQVTAALLSFAPSAKVVLDAETSDLDAEVEEAEVLRKAQASATVSESHSIAFV